MSNIIQENLGLAQVHAVCANMNAIWRPTTGNDLGIDGIIEFLEEGKSVSTGLMVGVQVKSGPSYFQHEQGNNYAYYPKQSNVTYWKNYILPVILVMYKPKSTGEKELCLFSPIKSQITNETNNKLLISKDKDFEPSVRQELINLANMHRFNPDIIRETLNRLKKIRYRFNNKWINDGPSITGIDILLASINYEQNYCEIHEARIFEMMHIAANGEGLSYSSESLIRFIERFLIHLSYCNITEPFWDYFSSLFYDYNASLNFIVDLTDYGNQLIGFLIENMEEYVDLDKFSYIERENNRALFDIIANRCDFEAERFELKDKSPLLYFYNN
ncbi:DUF4365 domain-containing protein [Bacillus sp. T_4]|nr:DUF4365 domain-containing protein [Bacillus sp. T_4]